MNGIWKLLDDAGWCLVLLACVGGAEWIAGHFDVGLAAIARRRARRIQHQERLRELELEARRRELEAAHPQPVQPICGCGHDLAFHHIETSACHYRAGEAPCPCQRYTGPEPLSQVYFPILTSQGNTEL
jgi:hypothetical protein